MHHPRFRQLYRVDLIKCERDIRVRKVVPEKAAILRLSFVKQLSVSDEIAAISNNGGVANVQWITTCEKEGCRGLCPVVSQRATSSSLWHASGVSALVKEIRLVEWFPLVI